MFLIFMLLYDYDKKFQKLLYREKYLLFEII